MPAPTLGGISTISSWGKTATHGLTLDSAPNQTQELIQAIGNVLALIPPPIRPSFLPSVGPFMHYLSSLLFAHTGDSHRSSAFEGDGDEGSFLFVLQGGGNPARQGSHVCLLASKVPKLQDSGTARLLLQDVPNFSLFIETRDLVPSCGRSVGTVGLGAAWSPQALWLSQLPFFPVEHQTLM